MTRFADGRPSPPGRSRVWKVGLYDPDWQAVIGGAQAYEGVLAETLAGWGHSVEIIHHRAGYPSAEYAEALGVDLSRVGSRLIEPPARPPYSYRNPWKKLRGNRLALRGLSTGYDLFVNCQMFDIPAHCHAAHGLIVTYFPSRHRGDYYGHRDPSVRALPAWKRGVVGATDWLDWRGRFATYDGVVTISEFSRSWVRRRWGVDAEILFPPVRTNFRRLPKENLIVCLSRIAYGKKHLEMLRAFRELVDGGLTGWRYAVVGSVGRVPGWDDARCAEDLRGLARGYPVDLYFDAEWRVVRGLLERAALFWHAKGVGVDPEADPDGLEHFGIATAEAMAAGCIPLAFRGGGQVEIVDDPQNGRLWSDLDGLKRMTRELAADPALRTGMAERARARAETFSRERLAGRFAALLDRVVGPGIAPARV